MAMGMNTNKWYPSIIGAGLALGPIHNSFLTELTSINATKYYPGDPYFFIPTFGYILLILGIGFFVLNNWIRVHKVGLGPSQIYIPLLIIVIAMGLTGITENGLGARLAPLFSGVAFFTLYVVGRVLGKSILFPMAIGAFIAILGIFAYSVVNPGVINGGYLFISHIYDDNWILLKKGTNYDISAGYILLATSVFIHRYRPILIVLGLIAMIISGSPEGIFAGGIFCLVIIIRKDWHKKLLYAAIPIAILISLWLSINNFTLLNYTKQIITFKPLIAASGLPGEDVIGYRMNVIKKALINIKPFGEGYNLTNFGKMQNVHNVPLVLIQQMGYIGILAALAWLWVAIYCLIKTKWRYAWIMILTLSIWDHFIWTQLGPWFWVIAGISSGPFIISDRIFRIKKRRYEYKKALG